MTVTLDVRDDPDHPEGGHALVLFRSVAQPGGSATLWIEPLTEGFDYNGPRRLDVAGRVLPEGFEVPVGPDVVAALPPGIAVSLGLEGTGVAADVLWPTLSQKAAEPRRQAVRVSARRVVVSGSAPPRTPPSPIVRPVLVVDRPQEPDRKAPETRPNPERDSRDPRLETLQAPDASAAEATVLGAGQDAVAIVDPITPNPEPSSAPTVAETIEPKPGTPDVTRPATPPTRRDPRPGWRTGSVAAAVALAFLLGAGGVGGVWLTHPAPVAETVTAASLPSPYDMLHGLASRSPGGVGVVARDAASFRTRGDEAGTPGEATFWHDWATRSLLTDKTTEAAAALSDFATELARGRGTRDPGDASALAAARFLWEMSALASDCAAMDNIAAALSRDGQGGTDRQAAVWRDRATLCRSAAKAAR